MRARDEVVIEVFRRAALDRSHGASEIEETLIRGLLTLRPQWQGKAVREGANLLAESNPAMANLRSLAERAGGGDLGELAAWLERRLRLLEELPARLTANAWPRLRAAQRVVTLSRSASVAVVLEGAWKRGWPGSVVVLDGTATGHGQDQARRLAAAGEALSQPDASASQWLDGPGTVVLVGADAVGSLRFVNAMGTRTLLELARARGVDRVLIADTGKDVAENAVDELLASSLRHREEAGREWMVFEAVPVELVTVRVSEVVRKAGREVC